MRKNLFLKTLLVLVGVLVTSLTTPVKAWYTITTDEDIYFDATDQYTRWELSTNNLYMKIYYGDNQSSSNIFQMTQITGSKLYYSAAAKGHSNVSGIEFFAGSYNNSEYTYSYGTGTIRFNDWSNVLDRLDRMCYTNSTEENWEWDGWINCPPLSTISLDKYNTTIYGGDGTSEHPYLVAAGSAVQVEVTSTKRSTNLTAHYKFTVDATTDASYSTSATKTVIAAPVDGTTYAVYVQGWGYNNSSYSHNSITSNTVYFTGIASYQLTYSIGAVEGNDGDISTDPTTASGTYIQSGNTVTLTAPAAKAGYTWKGWYTNAAGTEGKIDDTNRAITVTMNADKTLYACYTENMSALTVSMDYTSAAASACSELAAPTPAAASIGIATTMELTATEAPAGYKLTWALTHCAITVGNENSAVITVRSDGSGEAASAVANYDEDLSSNWYLVGDAQIFPEGWESVDGSMMLKKTGHSAESNVYMDITVADVKTYLFKITYHTDAITNWYGYSDVDWLEWTATDTKTVYTGSGNGHELKFTPTYAGKYEFKVDYSGANPAVTITYPAGPPTAIDEAVAGKKAVKRIVNGQLVIEREGKMYNALGAEVK